MTNIQPVIPQGCPASLLAGSFNTWITDLFQSKATFDRKDVPVFKFSSITAYYERHLYFVTMHFRPGLGAVRNSRLPVQNGYLFNQIYKGWYLSVCEKLLGSKFHKKPIRQPFSMAFLDVEGSRQHKAASAFQIPHIHALILAHPTSADLFRQLAADGRLSLTNDHRISKVDVLPFRDQGRSAEPMMTYTAKYARETIGNDRLDETWSRFPDLNAYLYPFYEEADLRLHEMAQAA